MLFPLSTCPPDFLRPFPSLHRSCHSQLQPLHSPHLTVLVKLPTYASFPDQSLPIFTTASFLVVCPFVIDVPLSFLCKFVKLRFVFLFYKKKCPVTFPREPVFIWVLLFCSSCPVSTGLERSRRSVAFRSKHLRG